MAEAIDLTIPFDTRKETNQNIAKIKQTMGAVERNILNLINFGKTSAQKNFEKTKKFITDFFMPTIMDFKDRKLKKIKDKLTLFYEKHIMKNKFFSTVVKKLSAIGKRLARFASNSFWKILGALIGLAILDPKGKILKSIINVLGKALTWILKTIAQHLPSVIKNVINLVRDVLPGIIIEFVRNFFPQISYIFRDLAKQLEKDTPILAWMFKQLGKAFGKEGVLYKFAMLLGKLSPALIAGILALGGAIKLFGILSSKLFPLIKVIGKFLPIMLTALKGLAAFLVANPIVLAVAASIAILVALYKWSDKVSAASGKIIDKYEGLEKSSNIFSKALAAIISPFMNFVYALKGLADFFSIAKKEGWGVAFKKLKDNFIGNIKMSIKEMKTLWGERIKTFQNIKKYTIDFIFSYFQDVSKFFKKWSKNITNGVMKTFKSILKSLTSILGKILDIILLPFKKMFTFFKKEGIGKIINKVKKGFSNLGSIIWNKMEKTFGNLFQLIAKPFNAIMSPIKKLIDNIKPLLHYIINTFNSLRDTFSAFISSPWRFLRKQEEQGARVLTARIARETGGGGVDLEKIIKFAKGDAVRDITPKEEAIGKEIKKETGAEGFKGLTEQQTRRIITKVSKIKINDIDESTKRIGS